MYFKIGVSSNAELPNGPRTRSKYEKNPDLNTKVSLYNSWDGLFCLLNVIIQDPEVYRKGAEVFLKGPRGVDPNPYKIWKILDNGQYKLSRDGKSDGKVYKAVDLKGVP